jgi:hypothetical protein
MSVGFSSSLPKNRITARCSSLVDASKGAAILAVVCWRHISHQADGPARNVTSSWRAKHICSTTVYYVILNFYCHIKFAFWLSLVTDNENTRENDNNININNLILIIKKQSRDSSGGIVLGYVLEDRSSRVGFSTELGIFLFITASRTALGSPIQWVTGAIPGGKAAGEWR